MNRRHFITASLGTALAVTLPLSGSEPKRIVIEGWRSAWFDHSHQHGTAVTHWTPDGKQTIRFAVRSRNTSHFVHREHELIAIEKQKIYHTLRRRYGADVIIIE